MFGVSSYKHKAFLEGNAGDQQVRQVLDVLKRQGPLQTYRAVMKKLDAYSPLGYSSAGTVLGVGDDVVEFGEGD